VKHFGYMPSSLGQRGVVRKLAALALSVGLLGGVNAWARGPLSEGAADLPAVALKSLPREAQRTHERILSGGPFPYAKDGVSFGNRERLLPRRARGYYREYTVETPGSRDRGARRIVCGGRQAAEPEACFYTGDHYASFKRIEP
jgi:ribonuclease T1